MKNRVKDHIFDLEKMSSLTEIIQLFESRHTEQLTDRHAEAILHFSKLYKTSGKVIYYKELEELAHVLGLVHKSLASGKVLNITTF